MGKLKNKIVSVAVGLGMAYAVNFCFCLGAAVYTSGEKIKTAAYQECKKTSTERWELTSFTKNHSQYLSEENKKALETRIKELEVKEKELAKELKPYDERAQEWLNRASNPLEYFE